LTDIIIFFEFLMIIDSETAPCVAEEYPILSCSCTKCKKYFKEARKRVREKRKKRKEDAAWRIFTCWRRNKTRFAEQKRMLFRQWNIARVDECPICLETHRMAVLPCGHAVGLRCIRKWCHQEDVRAEDCEEMPDYTCPLCRASFK